MEKGCRWALFFVALAFGLYFRTYPMRDQGWISEKQSEAAALDLVSQKMRNQIKEVVQTQYPQMAPDVLEKIASARADEIAAHENAQFQRAVADAKSNLLQRHTPKQSRFYLLEADSYHYFQLLQNVADYGKPGPVVQHGKYFNPLRLAPHGAWSFMVLHPYVGFLIYKAMHLLNQRIDLMEAAAWTPLFLMVLTTLAYFWLGRILQFSAASVFAGALCLLLSPIYLQRGTYGWYDTDPYNLIFPLAVLSCFFWGASSRKQAVRAAVCGGFLTGFYALFWVGWPFLLGIILGMGCLIVLLRRKWRQHGLEEAGRFMIYYVPAALLTLCLFLTPQTFLESLIDAAVALSRFIHADASLWPNVFVAVGETRSINLQKLIFLSGHYGSFAIFILGITGGGFYAWKRRAEGFWMSWLASVAIMLPLLVLALKTERFVLLFLLPFSVLVAWGLDFVQWGVRILWSRFLKMKGFVILRPVLLSFFVFVVIGLPQFVFAHALALHTRPIMNDAWFSMLHHIRTNTPADAILYAWWPPGHFITSIAQRAAVTDGASQHLPACYWIARLFMAKDEREVTGILRMLDAGGNQAVEFLEKQGTPLPESIKLIDEIILYTREDAAGKLPAHWDEASKKELLDQTHGSRPPRSAYLFVYNEMIENALAVSVMGEWDFERAREILHKKFPSAGVLGGKPTYVDRMRQISRGFVSYSPPSPLQNQDGDQYFFANGFRYDALTHQAMRVNEQEMQRSLPWSLLYLDAQDQLQETPMQGEHLDVSALVFDVVKSGATAGKQMVLADRRLLRSLMFRLYYLDARGYQGIKLVETIHDPITNTHLKLFRVDWPEAENLQAQPSMGTPESQI